MSTLSNSPHKKTPEQAQALIIKAAPETKTYFTNQYVQKLLRTTCKVAWNTLTPSSATKYNNPATENDSFAQTVLPHHRKVNKNLTWQDTIPALKENQSFLAQYKQQREQVNKTPSCRYPSF